MLVENLAADSNDSLHLCCFPLNHLTTCHHTSNVQGSGWEEVTSNYFSEIMAAVSQTQLLGDDQEALYCPDESSR